MFRGRILIVSDRMDVVAELDPLIRAEGHLSLAVPALDEALEVLEEGIIPDIVITDLASQSATEAVGYLAHFRQLNQLGQHLTVTRGTDEEAARAPLVPMFRPEPFAALSYPFAEASVRAAIQQAMDRIRRDLESLRAEMFRETARLQKAIRAAQLEMVTALAVTMEAKDPYMLGHCERVAELSRRIGEELGLEEKELETLTTAALLHEIGKIAVPLELLHKQGALTAGELDEVRSHTKIGAQIVTAVPSLRRLAPLIEAQYIDYAALPEWISPEKSEFLLASILRVADVFDAMTSDRSYRGTLPREAWERTLRQGAGSFYHPGVIDAFFRLDRQRGELAASA